MTSSPADRQRLKRRRRAEAGMVKVEAWLSQTSAGHLARLKQTTGRTVSEIVDYAIDAMGRAKR